MRLHQIYMLLYALMIFAGCKSNLSKEEEVLIFESEKFKEPLTIDLPFPSDEKNYFAIVDNPTIVDDSFIPAITFEVTTDKALKKQNPKHVSFLESINMINIRKAQQSVVNRFGETNTDFDFVFYTEKIHEFDSCVIQRNTSSNKCNLLKVGKRQFVLIEKINKIKKPEASVKEILFTYKIVPSLPFLTLPERTFKGVAVIARYNQNEGWKLENITWSDEGSDYIISENSTPINDESFNISSIAPSILLPGTNSKTFYGINRGNSFSDIKKIYPTLSERENGFSQLVFPMTLNTEKIQIKQASLLFDSTSTIYIMNYEVSLAKDILFKKEEILNNIDSYIQNTLHLKLTDEANYNYGLSQKFYGHGNYGLIIGHGMFYDSKHIISIDVYFK